MRSTNDVLRRHDGAPAAAAVELVRRFRGSDEFPEAARAWVDWAAAQAPFVEISSKAHERHDPAAAAFELLAEATRDAAPFDEWVSRARQKTYFWGVRREGYTINAAMLSYVLACWPARDDLKGLPEWTSALLREGHMSRRHGWSISLLVPDYPDIAYALVGAPGEEAPAASRCASCEKERCGIFENGWPHMQLLLERKRRACPPDERDDDVLRGLEADHLLRDDGLVLTMREWLQAGYEAPDVLRRAIAPALQDPSHMDRWVALGLLCCWPGEQNRAVGMLVEAVRAATDPTEPLRRLTSDSDRRMLLLGRGLFFGRGWGRKQRPRILLPLSRCLLDRGVWPTMLLNQLVQPSTSWESRPTDHHPDDDHERAFEWVREMLAEALLSYALDDQAEVPLRLASLDAMERLAPGGEGSWVRALSKIKVPRDLRERAKQVQKVLVGKRSQLVDAELAITDAVEVFLAANSTTDRSAP